MPEHLDDFDLDSHIDRAFADLLEDVGGRTSPPSASAIIERARRRRTTTFAAAAAVVLIVGAAAVASGVGRPSAAPGPAGQLPAPHVLDRAAWSAATAGWVDGWGALSESDSLGWINKLEDPTCLATMPDNGPEPDRSGRLALTAGDRAVAFSALADFDDAGQAETSWRQLTDAVTGCGDANRLQELTWEGASAQSYALEGSKGREYLWLVREGRKMALTWYVGRTPALPAQTDSRILTTLAAGLQDPDSFRERDGSSTDSGSATSSMPINEYEFARALGGWSSGWEPSGNTTSDGSLPCLSLDTNSASTGGSGGSLGANGAFTRSTFSYEAAAVTAVQGTVSQLESCATPYDVSTLSGTVSVVIASSPAGVAWIVQDGPNVGVIEVQGGHPDPPAKVSGAVGVVIDQALHVQTP